MSHQRERTEILTDQKLLLERILRMFSEAKSIDVLTETVTAWDPSASDEIKKISEVYFRASQRGVKLRMITRINKENLTYTKQFLSIIELRHLDDARGNFVVSESEYMSSPQATSFQPGSMLSAIYSNASILVSQNRKMFEALWNMAVPMERRITEIEEGGIQSRVEVINDPSRVRRLFVDMANQAKKEILLMLPTRNAFLREQRIGVIDAIENAALERGVTIGIITPDSSAQAVLHEIGGKIQAETGRSLMKHKMILQASKLSTVTVLVIDRNASLIIEQEKDSDLVFEKAIGIATYSTRNSTVLANVRFFERAWEDAELREEIERSFEKERRSRKMAQLLQDILSHDIRNYNQISRISAETLKAQLDDNKTVLPEESNLIDSIIRAIDGSSDLIDRAKKLGRAISQESVQLVPVNLEWFLQKSINLVKASHPKRVINTTVLVDSNAQVLGDDMLEEVFVNLLSNAVSFTNSNEVKVEIQAEKEKLETGNYYWKVNLSDYGMGIPDELKGNLFERYLKSASGTGLGLSIVYALVVERYSGKVKVSNRVLDDHTKGTRFELWIPAA